MFPEPAPSTHQAHPGTLLPSKEGKAPPSPPSPPTQTTEDPKHPQALQIGESRIIKASAKYDIKGASEDTRGMVVFADTGIPYPTDSTLLALVITTFLLVIMR